MKYILLLSIRLLSTISFNTRLLPLPINFKIKLQTLTSAASASLFTSVHKSATCDVILWFCACGSHQGCDQSTLKTGV